MWTSCSCKAALEGRCDPTQTSSATSRITLDLAVTIDQQLHSNSTEHHSSDHLNSPLRASVLILRLSCLLIRRNHSLLALNLNPKSSLPSDTTNQSNFRPAMPSVTVGVATDTRTTIHCNVDVAQLASSPNACPDKENCPPAHPTLADRIKQRSRRASGPTQTPPQLILMATPQESAAAVGHRLSKRFAEAGEPQRPSRRRKGDRGEPIAVLDEADTAQVSHRPRARHGSTAADDSATNASMTTEIRPINDTAYYRDFAGQVVRALQQRHKPRPKCFGDRQNERILDLLRHATPANDEEMLFLSGGEASELLKPGSFHDGPLLTEGQQPMPLQSIPEFLGEYYDDESKVFVQDPSVQLGSATNFVKEVTIGTVKKRILQGKRGGRPRNCLELATHVEDGLRPRFLGGEDTRLLTKLKIEDVQEYAGRRSYPQGYKEVEKWALLAESGALTEPHQDSHGYSTYITVNEGHIGFGWLSYPSEKERKLWSENPQDLPSDRFRYVVLKPGQTVYFPAGTVHFVFRLISSGHTLAFGGHVLRCSNIVHWIRTMIEERANPDVTNEDLTSSAPGYLDRVGKFVKQAQDNGTVEKWGGAEAVAEFLRLKAEFMGSTAREEA